MTFSRTAPLRWGLALAAAITVVGLPVSAQAQTTTGAQAPGAQSTTGYQATGAQTTNGYPATAGYQSTPGYQTAPGYQQPGSQVPAAAQPGTAGQAGTAAQPGTVAQPGTATQPGTVAQPGTQSTQPTTAGQSVAGAQPAAMATSGGAASIRISIDSPANGATVANGANTQIGGWAADTAGGPGAIDSVKIYLDGPMDSGGTLIGIADLGGARPDVGASLGNPAFANSGFDFVYSPATLTGGAHTIYVYAHSTANGWAYNSINVAGSGPAPTTAQSAPGGQAVAGPGGYAPTTPYGGSYLQGSGPMGPMGGGYAPGIAPGVAPGVPPGVPPAVQQGYPPYTGQVCAMIYPPEPGCGGASVGYPAPYPPTGMPTGMPPYGYPAPTFNGISPVIP